MVILCCKQFAVCMEALSTFVSLRWHWGAVIKRLHKRSIHFYKPWTHYTKKPALWHVSKVPLRKSRLISSDAICGHIHYSKIFLKTSIKIWHMISTLTSLHTSYSRLGKRFLLLWFLLSHFKIFLKLWRNQIQYWLMLVARVVRSSAEVNPLPRFFHLSWLHTLTCRSLAA